MMIPNPFSAGSDLILRLAIPILVGYLIVPVMDAIKNASRWLDSQNSRFKEGVVFVIAALAQALSTIVGVGIPADISQWDSTLVRTVLTWVIALAIKRKSQVRSLEKQVGKR